MTGPFKFFNDSKGFGFITNEEEGEDRTKGLVTANVQVLKVTSYTFQRSTNGWVFLSLFLKV
jgi:hypothetical protein